MRRVFVLMVATAMMLALAAPAGATPPADVLFEAEMSPLSSEASGPFAASGQAVDDGLICDSGDVVQQFLKVTGSQSSKEYVNFQVIHLFDCDDGSGEFLVKLQVRVNQNGDNFQWNIVGGTGAYEDLHGSGNGFGLGTCGEDCVFDVYNGGLHIN